MKTYLSNTITLLPSPKNLFGLRPLVNLWWRTVLRIARNYEDSKAQRFGRVYFCIYYFIILLFLWIISLIIWGRFEDTPLITVGHFGFYQNGEHCVESFAYGPLSHDDLRNWEEASSVENLFIIMPFFGRINVPFVVTFSPWFFHFLFVYLVFCLAFIIPVVYVIWSSRRY